MDANLAITRMKDAPVDFSSSGSAGLLTVDPVSGDFLCFTADGLFYVYDVVGDMWTLQPGSNFFDPNIQDITYHIWEVVAAPLSKYGVVTFAKVNYSYSTLYLYKHAASSSIQCPNVNSKATEGLRVEISPNPCRSSVAISISRPVAGKISAGIYNVEGKAVADLAAGFIRGSSVAWDATGLPAGIYLFKASVGGKKYSKTLFLEK
jgi:hypothetical protein